MNQALPVLAITTNYRSSSVISGLYHSSPGHPDDSTLTTLGRSIEGRCIAQVTVSDPAVIPRFANDDA